MGDGITLPVEQLLHLKWRAPIFASQGNSMILPAFQAIELLTAVRGMLRPVVWLVENLFVEDDQGEKNASNEQLQGQ